MRRPGTVHMAEDLLEHSYSIIDIILHSGYTKAPGNDIFCQLPGAFPIAITYDRRSSRRHDDGHGHGRDGYHRRHDAGRPQV